MGSIRNTRLRFWDVPTLKFMTDVDAMANFYEILAEKTEELSDDILETLLQHRGILSKMYQVWLKKYSSCYSEMQQHVEDELQGFVKELRGDEKDGKLHK